MSVHRDDRGVTTTTVTTHGGSDMRAAYTGLITGAIALLVVVVSIVMLTNRKFDREHEAAPAGAHGAAPPATPH